MSNDPTEEKKSSEAAAPADSIDAEKDNDSESAPVSSTTKSAPIDADEGLDDLEDLEDEESVSDGGDGESDLEDAYERPVLIGLGLFVLLIVAVMIQKAPSVDSQNDKKEQVQERKAATGKQQSKASKDKSDKDQKSEGTSEKTVKKSKKKNAATSNKPLAGTGLTSVDRVGVANFSIGQTATQTEQTCVYSIEMSEFAYLSENALSKLGLSGVQLFTFNDGTAELTYSTNPVSAGCNGDFSYADDAVLFSTVKEGTPVDGLVPTLTTKALIDTPSGQMLVAYPKTRVRVKIDPNSVPDSPEKLIVSGFYLGGYMRSNSMFLHGDLKAAFDVQGNEITTEVDYQQHTDRFSFIISSVRDFLLINYIAVRADGSEVVLFGQPTQQ